MKTLIIAEAGVNHNGDMELAKGLIEAAATAGADMVKFQSFKAEAMVSKTAPKADYQKTNSGPDDSQYRMLKKLQLDRDRIIPEEKYGLKVLSIGFFVQKENAIVWRGPMASNALKQLIGDTYWGELDYFLIDLPPGTSDIHLTLVQNLKLSGAIVVTTPQQVALTDARKAVDMFQNEKINVPILGLVENMSWFTPAELPQNRYYLFGKDGGAELAKERGVPLLGQIPLVQSVCESGDAGRPAALNADTVMGQAFRQLAAAVQERLEKR
jgi:ATP-binding protein involved in chromosome partitioning